MLHAWPSFEHAYYRLDAAMSSISRAIAAGVAEARLDGGPPRRRVAARRPLDEGDRVRRQVVVQQRRVLALEAREPVEVEVGDPSRPPR